MRREDVIRFAIALHGNGLQTYDAGRSIITRCPFPEDHGGGIDENPSFSIMPNDSGFSSFRCFGCGASGTLADLIHILTWRGRLSEEVKSIFSHREIFFGSDGPDFPVPEDPYDALHRINACRPPVPVPRDILSQYPPLTPSTCKRSIENLMAKRGFELTDAAWAGVRIDPFGPNLVFPITLYNGDIVGLHRRGIYGKSFSYLWSEMPTGNIRSGWFGFDKAVFGSGPEDFPILLVEGHYDLLRLLNLGVHNVLASCGPPTLEKLSAISSARIVYLGFDSDSAGKEYTKRAFAFLKDYAEFVVTLDWSVAQSKDDENLPAKDAGDLCDYRSFRDVVHWAVKEQIPSMIVNKCDGTFKDVVCGNSGPSVRSFLSLVRAKRSKFRVRNRKAALAAHKGESQRLHT